jgi:hypothetical protein
MLKTKKVLCVFFSVCRYPDADIELVSKNAPLFARFKYKNEHFTKTGSGQTWKKHSKKGPFSFPSGYVSDGLHSESGELARAAPLP